MFALHALGGESSCKMFALDARGDHVSTYTAILEQKAHGWPVEQIVESFHTTHKVKTHQVARSRGQWCVDIELTTYVADAVGPMPLVPDLCITHERWGSSSNPLLNDHVHYPRPHDIDRPLHAAACDKIRDYHAGHNNRPSSSISFMSVVASTSGRLHCELVRILLLQTHRKTDRCSSSSGVQLAQTN
jgi:hypothetical protein